VDTQLLAALLGIRTHRLGVKVLAAAATVLALVHAEKEVILIKAHVEGYLIWVSGSDFARIAILACPPPAKGHLEP
jgi:hypothetical protein